ncbi:hypothetical protein HGRIS_002867 [Hohenbuehelia grisea]|uniref:Uncharacterized protein n=1 Tax=Hohenbuehelia grisea TaxID=104357 RepID=A0ABR3JLR7_9AGAR
MMLAPRDAATGTVKLVMKNIFIGVASVVAFGLVFCIILLLYIRRRKSRTRTRGGRAGRFRGARNPNSARNDRMFVGLDASQRYFCSMNASCHSTDKSGSLPSFLRYGPNHPFNCPELTDRQAVNATDTTTESALRLPAAASFPPGRTRKG